MTTNRTLRRALLTLVVALTAGCGSSGKPSDAGAGGDAGSDAAPSACGDAGACATGQLCVSHQSCATMTCTPPPDGGACPAGTSATASCPATGQPGCLGGCPTTAGCQTRPAACATLSCSCAASLCAPDTCLATSGDHVACAAP